MAERVVRPAGEDWDDFDPEVLLPRPGSRKPPKLTRLPRRAPIISRKRKPDVAGLLTESEYQALRTLVFTRAGWVCERCGERKHLEPHHRKLLAQGGPDAAWNLAALCRQCHAWCHAHPRLAQAGGWIVPGWADSVTRAMLLHTGELVLLGADGGYAWRGRT